MESLLKQVAGSNLGFWGLQSCYLFRKYALVLRTHSLNERQGFVCQGSIQVLCPPFSVQSAEDEFIEIPSMYYRSDGSLHRQFRVTLQWSLYLTEGNRWSLWFGTLSALRPLASRSFGPKTVIISACLMDWCRG